MSERNTDKQTKDTQENNENNSLHDSMTEERKQQLKEETEQLEALLKAIKAIEAEKKKKHGTKPKRRNLIAIEFGGAFHSHPLLNLMMYYLLNLTVIYGVVTVFGFGSFSTLISVLMFVLVYTVAETFFRAYVIMNHIKFVLQTFGFIFYLGYLTLFFLIDWFLFPKAVSFENATLFVMFVLMFVFIRYVIAQLLKWAMLKGVAT